MKVKLLKDHTHQHKSYKAGDVIDVHESFVDWLIRNGIAEKIERKTGRR